MQNGLLSWCELITTTDHLICGDVPQQGNIWLDKQQHKEVVKFEGEYFKCSWPTNGMGPSNHTLEGLIYTVESMFILEVPIFTVYLPQENSSHTLEHVYMLPLKLIICRKDKLETI